MIQNEKRQRGSITIEATIALTAYIFVIISILSFINICRAQMAVSMAVDATAKEMSQYSYFYGISGLQSLSDTLKTASGNAEDTTNQLIGYTKTMCTSLGGIGGAVKDGAENIQQGGQEAGGADSLNAAINAVKKNAEELQANGTDIKKNADALVGAAKSFGDSVKGMDMEAYMRSLGALMASESYHTVLSRIICPALAKGMCAKHLEGYGNGDADAALVSMGITEGMDGLNFLMSDMFSAENPTQIHLVCYYAVEFSNLVDLPGDTRLVFCKEAVTNAWLNGYYKKGADEKDKGGTSKPPQGTPENNPDTGSNNGIIAGGGFGENTEETTEENTEENIPNVMTGIDDKVTDAVKKDELSPEIKSTFTDGQYRTVVTNEDIVVYRVFGGNSDAGGGYATTETSKGKSEESIRQDAALLPEWGGTCEYEAVIVIPKGTVINIGTAEKQTAGDGTEYAGGGDQILMPNNWFTEHPEWIKEMYPLEKEED